MNTTTNNQPLQFAKRKIANLSSVRPVNSQQASSWPTIVTLNS